MSCTSIVFHGDLTKQADLVSESLRLMEQLLHGHGPACVCTYCRPLRAAQEALDALALCALLVQARSRDNDAGPVEAFCRDILMRCGRE